MTEYKHGGDLVAALNFISTFCLYKEKRVSSEAWKDRFINEWLVSLHSAGGVSFSPLQLSFRPGGGFERIKNVKRKLIASSTFLFYIKFINQSEVSSNFIASHKAQNF